jgi:hypothetical protein
MTLKTNAFDSNTFTYKIVFQDDTLATANIDVTQGQAGSIQSIDFDNGRNTNAYLKLTLTDKTPVVGTTSPDIMFYSTAGTNNRWYMPDGIAFTTLSFWATTAGADNATTSPSGAASPSTNALDQVIVTLVTS